PCILPDTKMLPVLVSNVKGLPLLSTASVPLPAKVNVPVVAWIVPPPAPLIVIGRLVESVPLVLVSLKVAPVALPNSIVEFAPAVGAPSELLAPEFANKLTLTTPL